MVYSMRVFIWSALCIGLAFCDEQCTSCNGRSVTCVPRAICPNPKLEVKKGKQILNNCVTSDGKDGVCCIIGGKAGVKSADKCKEYANSVYQKVYNGMKGVYETINTCVDAEHLIVNGEEADPMEFPHMALLGSHVDDYVNWHCGGSLVSDSYVLSAAHCIEGYIGKVSRIRLGEFNYSTSADEEADQADAKDYDIVEWLLHPGYSGPGFNDIALFKLNQTVEFTKFVRPICLNSQPVAETQFIATGWGLTENNTFSDTLRKVNLTLTDCINPDEYGKLSRICAADLANERDTCGGDSGGPLQISLEEPYCMYLEFGVTSTGPKPCGKERPGVYMNVAHYLPWIESIVWPEQCIKT